MKSNIYKYLDILLMILLFYLSFVSCKKEKNSSFPVIQLITDSSYVHQDSMLQINQKIIVGLKVSGDATLTYLGVKLEADSQTYLLLDSGIHCNSFRYNRLISKGAANVEKWTFTVMDENRKISSVSLNFSRDPSSNFGPIKYHSSLYLGAQLNTSYWHCLSMPSGLTFSSDSALLHQDLIDIIFYYNPGGGVPPYEATFSSPRENDVTQFYPFISAFTVLNSTYYNPVTTVTLDQFNNCMNDSLLLASYDESNGKRKFKNTVAGNIIPFKTQAGKKGLIHVINVGSGTDGWVQMEVKVQE